MMPLAEIAYPQIDPVFLRLGPLQFRWYGLMYILALAAAYFVIKSQAAARNVTITKDQLYDLIVYAAVGVFLGGRLGYVLFYNLPYYLEHPLKIVAVWEGGMSFHGGLIGGVLGIWWFGRRTGRSFLQVGDFVAPLVPLGLGLGRLGNFANTELPGRMTDSVFGLVYPCSAEAIRQINPLCVGEWEGFARHPSPLYQAFAEGLVLFAVVWWFSSRARPVGAVSGVFLAGYGVLRFVTEFYRTPDAHLGFVALDWMTMGQILSLPMIIIGILLLLRGRRAGAA